MFKKICLTIILILVLSNIICISMYVKSNRNYKNCILRVYILEGKNQNWAVENYKIILSNNEFKTGGAKIQFIGNKNDLDLKDLIFYEIEVIKVDKVNHEKKDTLITKSISSNKPDLFIYKNLGCGEVSSNGKVELSNYDLNGKYDIYAIIKYKKKDGILKEEKIKLNVITSISSNNEQINVSER